MISRSEIQIVNAIVIVRIDFYILREFSYEAKRDRRVVENQIYKKIREDLVTERNIRIPRKFQQWIYTFSSLEILKNFR